MGVTRKLEEYLEDLAEQLDYEITTILEKNKKVATGRLVNSISTEISAKWVGKSNYKSKITVDYEDYGNYVLSGRKPGSFPNFEAIKKWLKVKNPKFRSPKVEKELNGITFAVCKKIQRDGIPAVNFLKPVQNILKSPSFINEIGKNVTYDIGEDVKIALK